MIRKKLMAQFKSEQWSKHALLNSTVQDGTVKLWGRAFAIFVLQTDAWERKRDAERNTAERAQ